MEVTGILKGTWRSQHAGGLKEKGVQEEKSTGTCKLQLIIDSLLSLSLRAHVHGHGTQSTITQLS